MTGKNQQGIALVAVMWALALLSLAAAAVALESRTSVRVASNMANKAVARAAADAGLQLAILDLVAPRDAPTRFRTDGTNFIWRFANCEVRISIRDEASKIDVNKAPGPVLVTLFVSDGIDLETAQSLADAIIDFRDADSFSLPKGAEQADYKTAGLKWGPKNAPLESLEELQQVLGMTAKIYERVAPDLTVYSAYSVYPHRGSFDAGERMSTILKQAAFYSQYFTGSPGLIYSVLSEAKNSSSAIFDRKAIVKVTPPGSFEILDWRETRRDN